MVKDWQNVEVHMFFCVVAPAFSVFIQKKKENEFPYPFTPNIK